MKDRSRKEEVGTQLMARNKMTSPHGLSGTERPLTKSCCSLFFPLLACAFFRHATGPSLRDVRS